jgi:hypothetical protein
VCVWSATSVERKIFVAMWRAMRAAGFFFTFSCECKYSPKARFFDRVRHGGICALREKIDGLGTVLVECRGIGARRVEKREIYMGR